MRGKGGYRFEEGSLGWALLERNFRVTMSFVDCVGRSRAAVTNALRLFQLPATVQRYVRDGSMSAGHARALLMTPDREVQERLALAVFEKSLSVRALEDEVRA